jgi:hypothetical protein
MKCDKSVDSKILGDDCWYCLPAYLRSLGKLEGVMRKKTERPSVADVWTESSKMEGWRAGFSKVRMKERGYFCTVGGNLSQLPAAKIGRVSELDV